MIDAGELIFRIQKMLMDDSAETKAEILAHLNSSYMELAEEHPWHLLTSSVSPIPTVMPGDMTRILYVEDGQDKQYFKIGYPQRYASMRLYNYFDNLVVSTPLLTVADAVVVANSTTVTSATGGFTAGMVGEYVRFGANRGIYLIATVSNANTILLANGYRGVGATAQVMEVRPTGTRQFIQTDYNGSVTTPSPTAKMWYLKKPLPLYNDTDQVQLPGECDALRIKVLQIMMVSDKYDNDSLKQDMPFEKAYAKMKSLNPLPDRFVIPRDAQGARIRFGRYRNITPVSIHSEKFY